MKLQRIRYFVTLAETLSFSRTAQIHYVSQTTVSQQIRALETELGRDLFTRTKRKVELTPAGRLYLEEVGKALSLVDDADERVRLFAASEPLSLRLLIANGITPGYVAPLLRGFGEACPDVVAECSYCSVGELYARLLTGEADVVLAFDPDGRERPGVTKALVERLTNYVVVSNRSPLAHYARLTRGQLAGERFVNTIESRGFIRSDVGNDEVPDDFERVGGERAPVMVDTMDALLLRVSLGDGCSLLAEPLVQTIVPSLNLAAIPLAEEGVPLVACRRADDDGDAARRFIDYACD